MAVDNTTLFRALIKIAEKNASEGEAHHPTIADGRHQSPASKSDKTTLRPRPAAATISSPHYRLYSSHARQILADISELRDLVLDKRKEYIFCSNAYSLYGAQRFMSEGDRKKFDQETDLAIKQCTKLIKDLEVQLNNDRQLRSADEQKHLMTVVSLLNSYLKQVLAIVAQLRRIHIRKTRQIRSFCRLANLVDLYSGKLAEAEKEEEKREAKLAKMKLALEENERKRRSRGPEKTAIDEKKGGGRRPTGKEEEKENDGGQSKDGWEDAEIPEILEEEQPKMIAANGMDASAGEGWSDAEMDLPVDLEQRSAVNEPVAPMKKALQPPKKPRKQPFIGAPPEESTAIAPSVAYEPANKAEQTQLVTENRKIFDRFTATDSELERIESHVAEIQRLQSMFVEKIGEQEQDIDVIHSRVVYTLDNLEQANDFIREAIKNQANRRVIMIFCLLVLTFTLLFLDWYNP